MLIVALTGAFTPASVSTQPVKPVCSVTFTQSQHASFTRKVYKRPEMSRTALRRVERMRVCQKTSAARRNALRLTRKLRKARRARQEAAALTPYNGWAVPEAIVMCESHGNWNAQNPSGARGPYQLMPSTYMAYGGNGSWSKADQHRIAAKVYAGGAGAGQWVCKA